MSLIDDVRRALQPLIDQGIVLDVQESLSGARYDTGGLQSIAGPQARHHSLAPPSRAHGQDNGVFSDKTGFPARARAMAHIQELRTAVMMWARILPLTGPGPNCLAIAAATISVASAKRSGS